MKQQLRNRCERTQRFAARAVAIHSVASSAEHARDGHATTGLNHRVLANFGWTIKPAVHPAAFCMIDGCTAKGYARRLQEPLL